MHLIVAGAPDPLMRGAGVCDLRKGFRCGWIAALTNFSKGKIRNSKKSSVIILYSTHMGSDICVDFFEKI
jgi:hypothetical protein